MAIDLDTTITDMLNRILEYIYILERKDLLRQIITETANRNGK